MAPYDLARESSVATRSGMPLPVTVLADGGLLVDGARVIRADIIATNGVLHVVDRVMIPPGTL
ncbi:MAG: fasciclin domain-containing protein [Methanospirillum sp.]